MIASSDQQPKVVDDLRYARYLRDTLFLSLLPLLCLSQPDRCKCCLQAQGPAAAIHHPGQARAGVSHPGPGFQASSTGYTQALRPQAYNSQINDKKYILVRAIMPRNTKLSPSDDDSVVTMSMLSLMLDQQKDFYTELIQQQQENFKSFVQIVIDGTNKRLDDVIRDVQDVKSSLQFTDGFVTELQAGNKTAETRMKEIEKEIEKSNSEHEEMISKLDFMENQSKRSNIIVDGIMDEKGETWETSEKKVRSMLKELKN